MHKKFYKIYCIKNKGFLILNENLKTETKIVFSCCFGILFYTVINLPPPPFCDIP